MSRYVVADELEINETRAKRLIKKFVDLGIIESIRISKERGKPSIYAYVTSKSNLQIDLQNISNSNSLSSINDL